jgi:hypothetical protein
VTLRTGMSHSDRACACFLNVPSHLYIPPNGTWFDGQPCVIDVAPRTNTQKEHRHLQYTSFRISIIALLVGGSIWLSTVLTTHITRSRPSIPRILDAETYVTYIPTMVTESN